ncbi:MAG TPA: ATP-binding protein [Allosphingosinicella sp.]|nr:ATP-binding protein [Allosphingosinicella sp.]
MPPEAPDPELTTIRRAWPLAARNCLLDSPEARLRLAATASMAATLVHEVNQPLAAATNYLSACARRLRALGAGHEDLLAMLDHAGQETLKAGELIRRTRNFVINGRISGRRENLRTIVERAILMIGERRDRVGITTEVPLGLFVKVDRIQLEQLLFNLLLNACEALAGRADGWIEIGAEAAADGAVLLSVTDNGPGLNAVALARLADPPGGPGAGLGLAIAAAVAEAHGSRLEVENPAEGGARFTVALAAAT